MRYYSSNFGCLIAILVMFIMFQFLGVISRLIFTTPLGIVLLITAGVWYIMRSRDKARKEESSFDNPSGSKTYEWNSDNNSAQDIKHDHDAPMREADDVDFTELDDNDR